MTAAGRLIAIEGIDGCGKSTQARVLAEALGAVLTHEPGATALGRSLRGLLLDPDGDAPSERAEALLMAADRAQHVAGVIRPALRAGRWVVTDRYSASTLAYQGYGRGLPLEDLRRLVAWATEELTPDLQVLVDVDPAVARGRAGTAPDRLERLDASFHDRVRQGYLALADAEPDRWAVVDGAGAVEVVASAVRGAVERRLGAPAGQGVRGDEAAAGS
ncbi:MAG: dTMP kinase [Acidobacteriota bacterium]|nr:dTMP kinase [Acidobacteriota bacterium]